MRHLQQDPRAVTRTCVGGDGGTVREILEKLERFLDDVARTHAVHVGDEADAARVVFERWIVQSLLFQLIHPGALAPLDHA